MSAQRKNSLAQVIVRGLAAADVAKVSPNLEVIVCLVCQGHGVPGDRLEHKPNCPFQLALDWVEEYGTDRG
jgi:hypothetical protein